MDSTIWWCYSYSSNCFSNEHDCDEFYGDDSTDPVSPLEIIFDGTKYLIPPESLLIQQNGYCELGIAIDEGNLQSDWILLGGGFFKDFIMTIDYDNSNYGFGLSKEAHDGAEINDQTYGPDDGDSGLAWWAIMLIVLGGLLLLLLILLCLFLFCCKRDKEEKEEEADGGKYSQVLSADSASASEPRAVNGATATDCRTFKDL